jgi:hypothetical protein
MADSHDGRGCTNSSVSIALTGVVDVRIVVGACRNELATIESGSVDCIITVSARSLRKLVLSAFDLVYKSYDFLRQPPEFILESAKV